MKHQHFLQFFSEFVDKHKLYTSLKSCTNEVQYYDDRNIIVRSTDAFVQDMDKMNITVPKEFIQQKFIHFTCDYPL